MGRGRLTVAGSILIRGRPRFRDAAGPAWSGPGIGLRSRAGFARACPPGREGRETVRGWAIVLGSLPCGLRSDLEEVRVLDGAVEVAGVLDSLRADLRR
jgi:hypothetical protein